MRTLNGKVDAALSLLKEYYTFIDFINIHGPVVSVVSGFQNYHKLNACNYTSHFYFIHE